MRHPLTLDHLRNTPAGRRKENAHLFGDKEKVKKSKYNNQIVEFDGFVFRSKKELGRYVALRSLEAAREIKDLQLQVPFELNEDGSHSLKYVCDFLYTDVKTGQIYVEDTKGHITQKFKKKAKLMLDLYGIIVKKT